MIKNAEIQLLKVSANYQNYKHSYNDIWTQAYLL